MNVWTKILIFLPLWMIFTGIFYGILFLIYPDSTGSKAGFDALLSNDYGFLISSQIAIFFGTFSAIFFVSRFIDKKKVTFLSSMLKPRGLLFGMALGLIQIILIIIVLSMITKLSVTFKGINISILIYVILFFIVAISEEALSRGFIFANIFNESNKYLAFVISSLIFSLMHALNSSFSWIGFINIFLIGIFFCQLYLKGRSLSIPIGFHFSWNLLQGPVFGFSVSGFTTDSIINIKDFSGANFPFDGFGLEGSLITTVVIGFFIVYFYIVNTRKIMHSEKPEPISIIADTLKVETGV